MILAIDPGDKESAYVLAGDDLKPVRAGKVANDKLLELVGWESYNELAIEMIASYGMPVGKEVFETCVWIGRYWQAANLLSKKTLVYRKDVKMHLCGQTKAKDPNIRQALLDRFGVVGTKNNPGWFYGFSKDMWAAYAVLVTYVETMRGVVK